MTLTLHGLEQAAIIGALVTGLAICLALKATFKKRNMK